LSRKNSTGRLIYHRAVEGQRRIWRTVRALRPSRFDPENRQRIMAMKLNSAMVERTLDQIEESQVIPDNHPAVPKLHSMFGEHTFFLDVTGLKIVEPTEPVDGGVRKAQVVKLAGWKDESHTSLVLHAPEPTDEVVVLEGADQE
jgi:hypothetical protein